MPKPPNYAAFLAGAVAAGSGSCAAAESGPTPKADGLVMSKIDTNRSGTITLVEATRAALAKFAALDTDKSGTLDANELTGVVSHNAAAKEDKDKDGTLDKQEYLALITRFFIEADKDRDGSLDAEELSSEPGRALVAMLSY